MEFKKDLHIVKEEIYDADIMEEILRDINTFPKSELNRLRAYKKSRKYGNKVDVIYHYGKGCEEIQLGRLYVKNNRGLQSFQREIRDALLEKHHFSIDMENAHYNLMIKLGTEWNINVSNIKYYCENRNQCLKMLSDDKKISKLSYLKKSICIGLIGDYYRKRFYFCNGERNTGKSLLTKAFRESFDGYIDEYDANNLLLNSNSQDEAKKLAWTTDLIGVRIAFSNECRMDKKQSLDGNLIKPLSSGSDTMKHRVNHENQKNFVNRATMFFLSNDIPNITPIDSGMIERAKFIRYKISFVNEPKKNNEKYADPIIKSKFYRDEYKDALFYLMVDIYNNLTDKEKIFGGNIQEPKSVLMETSEWIKDENMSFEEKILEKYEITNNKEDYVESKNIINYIIKDCNMNFSSVKIGRLLSSLINVEPRDMNIKNIKCRLGIREKLD